MRVLLTLADRSWPSDVVVIDWGLWRIYVGGRVALQGFAGHGNRGPSRTFQLAALIICAAPFGSIDYSELIDALWGEDSDGGPYRPINCIRAMLCAKRVITLLHALGITLRGNYRSGFLITCAKAG